MTAASINPAPPLTPAKVGVMLAVTAEAMYFAGLMAAYLVLRAGNEQTFAAGSEHVGKVNLTTCMVTLCAAAETLMMASRRDGRERRAWTTLTIVFAVFAASVIAFDVLGHGRTPDRSSFDAFGSCYYLIVTSLFFHIVATVLTTVITAARCGRLADVAPLWYFGAVVSIVFGLTLFWT